MSEIVAAIVIYNKKCQESLACQALAGILGIQIVIVDNSTADFGNSIYCTDHGWRYLSMHGNVGLPKAYNAVFQLLDQWVGLLVLLDDDTIINVEYFRILLQASQIDQTAMVFLPIVFDEKGTLSPCRIKGHRVARTQNPYKITYNEFTAINSGMALRMPLPHDLRYDESYFLDYADHAFFRLLREKKIKHQVLNVTIHQIFSNNHHDKASAIVRFKVFMPDFFRFCNESRSGIIYGWLNIMKRAWILTARYSSIAFTWQAISFFFKFSKE